MSSIPNFNPNPDLEALLEEDPTSLDEQSLIDVQRYKAKKLKAKRDAGESDGSPDWSMLKPGDFNGSSNGTVTQSDPTVESNGDDRDGKTDDTGSENKVDHTNTDGLQGYYSAIKAGTDIDKETSPANRSDDDKTPPTGDEQTSAGKSTSDASTTAPAAEPGSRSSEASAQLLSTITGRISELEDKLDEYHQQTLELKDTIADLREENARLKERVK